MTIVRERGHTYIFHNVRCVGVTPFPALTKVNECSSQTARLRYHGPVTLIVRVFLLDPAALVALRVTV